MFNSPPAVRRIPVIPFIISIQTTSSHETVVLPFGAPMNLKVDWGDGTPIDTGLTVNVEH